MTAHGASSSSSSSKLWKYDVFLSFRGEDTRKGFTGHLLAALKEKNYKAFIDEVDVKRGQEIKEELFKAIEGSKICIIVFSKRYADSSWCLDELVKILECRKNLGQQVLPIFYHVEASDIRKQKGSLAPIFQKHEDDIREEKDDEKRKAKKERVKQWRKALTQAANLAGQDLKNTDNGHEANLIRSIIDENIWELLPSTKELHVAKHIVGIDSRVQDIITYLSSSGSNNVVMVGILGMGGLGKTTAAKAIYNQIHHKFEFKSFLADISSHTSNNGLVDLQGKLVSGILKQTKSCTSVAEGISLIKHHLRSRRVLVIMDNIDESKQLDAIAGNHDWFGPGSRIIITTRNEHLLKQVEVDKTYPLREMEKREALELFSWHAFRKSYPNEEYLEVSEKVVSYCGGLPLALEVLGSFLFKRPIAEWESQLEKLERTPDGKIIKPLRISFEGLDDKEKAIFLDISCFFIGKDKDYVAKVLDGCEFSATIGISVLRERCLVIFEHNELNMHDLLREMARVIISEKSPGHPGKWSRLWNPREVIDVLTNKSGTEEVEGLALGSSNYLSQNSEYSFSTEAFANMKKLRLLQLTRVELTGEYKHFPKALIWLCWHGCPLWSIPNGFLNQEKLVILDMQWSRLAQVWEGSESLQKLKIIDLSYSMSLIKSPDFSRVPNLEKLILEDCRKLSEIHPSIGHLKKLSLVNLRRCYKLRSLPGDFYKSKSVETLLLCLCLEFRELHEDLGEMISFRILEANHTAITKVPPSIVRLKNLTRLSLSRYPDSLHGLNSLRELELSLCELADGEIPKDLGSLISLQKLHIRGSNFLTLPSLSALSKLETLCLNECCNLDTLPSLSGLSKLEALELNECFKLHTILDLPTNLKFLHAIKCHALKTMPNFSEMKYMKELNVSDSPKLTEVPGLNQSLNSMTLIDMQRCTDLTPDFRMSMLQGWTSCGFGGIFLHGNYVPSWVEFNNGNKVNFEIPPSDGRNFEGLTLFCNYCSSNRFDRPLPLAITVINTTKHTELRAWICNADWEEPQHEEDYFCQGQLSNIKLCLQGGDTGYIIFEDPFADPDCSVTVKRTGINLVWDKPLNENILDLDESGYVFDPHPARFYDEPSDDSDTIAVHDHDPLGLAHLRLSLSLDTLPAGCHIQPRSRRPHSQPRSRPQNLPVLLQRQPHGPAVSDNAEQISNSIDDDLLARLCKSFACLSLSPDHSSTFSAHI